MLIALIDDGVDTSIYPNLKLKFDLSVDRSGNIKNRNPADRILTDHGTTCARIITKYAPEAEFCSIRIFYEPKLRASQDQLVTGLEWCLDAGVPIIHLSVGSSLLSDYYSIRSVVAKLLHQRQVVIAAHSNNSLYSIPACLGGVFGVSADKSLIDDAYKYSYDRIKFPAFFASSRHRLTPALSGNETVTQITNSYAAPTITAHVHNILQEYKPFRKSIGQIYNLLSGEVPIPQFPKPDFIENAVIYNPLSNPLLKEHLFFPCVGECKERWEVLAYKDSRLGKSDLVYLLSAGSFCDEFAPELLKGCVNGFENILCGGALPPDNSLKQYNGFVWSEKNSEYLKNDYGKGGPNLDLPIINIIGRDVEALDLLCKLRDLFFENDYQCACLSDHKFSYLYSVEYVSESISWTDAIENVQRLYSPDLLLNCFRKEVRMAEPNSDEFFIFTGNGDKCDGFETFSLKNNKINFSVQNAGEVIHLFNRILEFFD